MEPTESHETPRLDHHGEVKLHGTAGYNATCACGWDRWTGLRAEAEALLIEHTARNNLDGRRSA
jgi:hypothetical protein